MVIKNHIYYNVYSFPVGGEFIHLEDGKKIKLFPELGVKLQDKDNVVWQYRGLSAYEADNKFRVNGWEKI